MKKPILFLVLSLSLVEAADARCRRGGDIVACFNEPFRVSAYSDAETGTAFFRAVKDEPKFFITTNDQTRRALVIAPCRRDCPDGSEPVDGYVSEFFFRSENVDAQRRWNALSYDQRAGGFQIAVPSEFLGGGLLLVYRRFDCRIRRSIDEDDPNAGGAEWK